MSVFKTIRKYAKANGNYKELRSYFLDELRRKKYILFLTSHTAEEASFFTAGIVFYFYNVGIGKTDIMAEINSQTGIKVWSVASASGKFITQEDVETFQKLSTAEFLVLRYMAENNTNDEISEKMVIAPATVRKNISSIYKKLGLRFEKSNAVKRSKAIAMYPKIAESREAII